MVCFWIEEHVYGLSYVLSFRLLGEGFITPCLLFFFFPFDSALLPIVVCHRVQHQALGKAYHVVWVLIIDLIQLDLFTGSVGFGVLRVCQGQICQKETVVPMGVCRVVGSDRDAFFVRRKNSRIAAKVGDVCTRLPFCGALPLWNKSRGLAEGGGTSMGVPDGR